MNSKTKIVVIRMKELIIGAIVAVAVIIILVLVIMSMTSNSSAGKTAQTSSSHAKTTSAEISDTYTPGVYTSSITLNGNPIDIQVTVDKNNINSIDMVNVSDSITTMYPMLQTSFNELAEAVMEEGSTLNISYSSDNRYTSSTLLNAIQAALDKCTIQ